MNRKQIVLLSMAAYYVGKAAGVFKTLRVNDQRVKKMKIAYDLSRERMAIAAEFVEAMNSGVHKHHRG